ncbi:GTPase family protein [Candidatus Methylospira mobilis]|nr:GTPase [Candidatus Methylospira mobilis]
MPMQLTRFALLLGVFFLLPWLALIGLGAYWLWEQNWLYYALGIILANCLLCYRLLSRRSKHARAPLIKPIKISPDPNWPDAAQPAWKEIEQKAESWKTRSDLFADPHAILHLSNEVLTIVARQFHAGSKDPILEFPLPYLLKLIVLVCEDIQHEVLDKIPGSHAVTVGDLRRIKQFIDNVDTLKKGVNVAHSLFNWPGAALGTAHSWLVGKGMNVVAAEVRQRLVNAYIRKLGFYAIQLYSGQLSLDDIAPGDILSQYAQQDIAQADRANTTVEPLRILIIGQVSSGKSSLLNEIFGDIKAAVGRLPVTPEITPYVLEHDGFKKIIVLDSPGYGGLAHNNIPEELKREWDKVDIILFVCHAAQAARQADAEQLNALRGYFQQERKNQTLPVILVAATHIDLLRPVREWQPPYNIQQPQRAKERSIRQACEAIAHDLGLELEQVLPVCMAPDRPAYNIEEGLIPLMREHLQDAKRVLFLRCLRHQQDIGYWRRWRDQIRRSGQIILSLMP